MAPVKWMGLHTAPSSASTYCVLLLLLLLLLLLTAASSARPSPSIGWDAAGGGSKACTCNRM